MEDFKDLKFYKGIGFILLFTVLSFFISKVAFIEKLGFSILIIAILLGIFLSNTLNKYDFIENKNSLNFCTKQLLRFAIVLYGFRLTVSDLQDIGIQGVLYSFIIVLGTFIFGYIIGVKILGIDKQIAILVSAGSSICGAAAVLATESVLKNKAYKTSIAISTVVLFGTLAMFIYPYLYNIGLLNLNEQEVALYIGGTLHEVAHVVGAANSLDNELISNNSVVVKMIRVMFLAPFLIFVALIFVPKNTQKTKLAIPWFAVLFIVVIIFNSFNIIDSKTIEIINEIDLFLLAMSMFALGYNTKIKEIISVGFKPLLLGLVLFIWLISVGYALVVLL